MADLYKKLITSLGFIKGKIISYDSNKLDNLKTTHEGLRFKKVPIIIITEPESV